jgi:predicted lactoylglutathione lyase
MKPNICIITLCVEDLEKSLKFYTEGLGAQGKISKGGGHIAIEPENGLPIALFSRCEYEKFAGDSAGEKSSRICVSHAAANREEVDGILARAEAAGGTVTASPKEYEWGYSGYFKDLDGHLWEVAHFAE